MNRVKAILLLLAIAIVLGLIILVEETARLMELSRLAN